MFYLAWVNNGNTTFGPTHYVEDEKFYAWKLEHQEENAAKLTLVIKNPRVGLLSASRKQWAWFSYRRPDNVVVPLFHGRLLGVPDDLEQNMLQIVLVGIPIDIEAQKEALALSLRVLPYFDPAFINPDLLDDADTALTGRTVVWHVGRTDKTVTVSDLLNGEDGIVVFGPGDHFYDGLSITHSGEALRQVNVEATVNWNQIAEGNVDITRAINGAFRTAGSGGQTISTFTGEGLQKDWRFLDDPIGGGWTFGLCTLDLLSGDGVTETFIDQTLTPTGGDTPGEDTVNPFDRARFYRWVFAQHTLIHYKASRSYTEVLSFSLKADVQDMLTQSTAPRIEEFKVGSSEVVALLDPEPDSASGTGGSGGVDAAMPLRDLRSSSYFNTARGRQSLEFLIACARVKLIAASRIATVSANIRFADAIGLSCRLSATITDPRIPGGAQGKVVFYSFGLDGTTGELFGSVTIACAVGRGNELDPPAEGTPTYCSADYVGADYQFYDGADVELIPGEVTYRNFRRHILDDALNFFNMRSVDVIKRLQVFNGDAAQSALLMSTTQPDVGSAVAALDDQFTYYELDLVPVEGGPFMTKFPVQVSDLMIPRMIDMEAT